jgi:hypothetical protein
MTPFIDRHGSARSHGPITVARSVTAAPRVSVPPGRRRGHGDPGPGKDSDTDLKDLGPGIDPAPHPGPGKNPGPGKHSGPRRRRRAPHTMRGYGAGPRRGPHESALLQSCSALVYRSTAVYSALVFSAAAWVSLASTALVSESTALT